MVLFSESKFMKLDYLFCFEMLHTTNCISV